MRVWLSEEVFGWTNAFYGGHRVEIERVRRPHEILAHAEGVLRTSESEFSVADCILNLKRSINSRLQHLEELYGFDALFPRGVGFLERLEQIGLARPFLARQLFELRNDIEHRDARPPTPQRAQELVDATWYFLRTTDYPCKLVPDSVILRSGEEGSMPPEQWITLRVARDNFQDFEVAGWVSSRLLQSDLAPGFLSLDLDKMRERPERPPEPCDEITRVSYLRNSARGDDERWILGRALLTQEQQRQFWRLAFDAL